MTKVDETRERKKERGNEARAFIVFLVFKYLRALFKNMYFFLKQFFYIS